MIIAVDGPAASGKGTLARRLAAHYGLRFLDTGSLYRMVALSAFQSDASAGDEAAAIKVAEELDPESFADDELRTAEVGSAASSVAAIPGVRAAILDLQRSFAQQPPGAVLDGRDIGTVVCPDAEVKLFVTASLEERAGRRYRELIARGEAVTFEQVYADLAERDERDASREISPLKPAAEAHLLDTSDLSIETAFQRACKLIDATRNI
ncbi:MAG: (d)CMP kinase [Hyphomicrobiales bacterium]